RPAYAAMDCVIMLARYQSFCLMLAEAMLARRPIVGLQGAGEYTEREYPLITQENALLFPREKPWDPNHLEPEGVYQKLANQMVHLTNNPMQVRHMVNSGYEWVSTRFSAERQAARCLQLYRNLVS
ncbi:MAG TPA: hypothetical protein PKA06_08530, partial [Gemmatales bacterium]|nr:hypothetical protein [Gemmatales bacterium]